MADLSKLSRIHVFGAGAWGTALAQSAALAGHRTVLVARTPEQADAINAMRENQTYLPGQVLSDNLEATGSDGDLGPIECALMVVPAQATRSTLQRLDADSMRGVPVVLCAKGLEQGTLKRQSEILAEEAPEALPLVLSGPSFAADVAAGRPTAVTLAANDMELAFSLAEILGGPVLRPYASGDLLGVEMAGALKNVYALACGAVEGAGLGLSARASVIARAYSEMTRLIVGLGGDAATLTGLAGLGDLTLSCTSEQSRNYAAGMALARGESLEGRPLAEGVKTAPVALALAQKLDVDVPLIEAANLLLSGKLNIQQIVARLMARPLKREGSE